MISHFAFAEPPLAEQAPAAVESLPPHAFAAETDGFKLNTRYGWEQSPTTSQLPQETAEKCLREMGVRYSKIEKTGTIIIQGTKSDTLNPDFYLFLSPAGGIQRLDMKDITKERPIQLKIKLGNETIQAHLMNWSTLPTISNNSMYFHLSEKDKKDPVHEVTLKKAEWTPDLQRFVEAHVTGGYKEGIKGAINRALVQISLERQEKEEPTLKADVKRIEEIYQNAERAYQKDRTDKNHQERMHWLRVKLALELSAYHRMGGDLTDAEKAEAVGILHDSEKTRLPELLAAYPHCRAILKNSNRDLFEVDNDKGLITHVREEFQRLNKAN